MPDEDSKPSVYTEDGVTIFRASSVGNCSRALVAARMGMTPQPPKGQMQEVFSEGHLHEQAICQWLEKGGVQVTSRQKRVELDFGFARIRGHIDGLLTGDLSPLSADGDHDFEVTDLPFDAKAFSQDNFDAYSRNGFAGLGHLGVLYRWQASVYKHALGTDFAFVVKNRNRGRHHVHLLDPELVIPLDEIETKLRMIEEWAARDEFPACPKPAPWPCSYAHLHEVDENAPSLQAAAAGTDIYLLIQDAMGAKLRRDHAAAEYEALADQIKKEIGEGKVKAGRVFAQVIKSMPQRVDSKALKKDYPDVYEAVLNTGRAQYTLKLEEEKPK